MDVKKLYELGERVDVAINPKFETVVRFYKKGKINAERIMQQRTKNVSLPKNELKRIAGIVDVTETDEINACCFAKLFYQNVNELEISDVSDMELYFSDLNRNLLRKRLAGFLHSGPFTVENVETHIAMGARAFAEYPLQLQEEILSNIFFDNLRIKI